MPTLKIITHMSNEVILTKEEILSNHFGDPDFVSSDYELKAMDEYAKQECIEFLKFERKQKIEHLKKQVRTGISSIDSMPEQLYKLYLQSKHHN